MDRETGARRNWDYQDLLSRLFHTSPVQLGWAADYTPAEPSAAGKSHLASRAAALMGGTQGHIKQEILDCCCRSMQYGLNFNTQGNISVRVPASGLIAITPTGLEYDRMAADDIVVVDAEGRRVEGERHPSSETDVHLVVYRRGPDVNAIVHTEPVYSNVFGVLGRPIEAVLINMAIYSRAPVPVMPFMPSNSTEFGEAMVKVVGTRNAVIWGNHGLMTVGADLTSAFRCNVTVETAARVQHAALCLGQPHVLSYAELNLAPAP